MDKKPTLKKYNKCSFCGELVISPTTLKNHLSCSALNLNAKKIEIDLKDIKLYETK